MAYWNNLKFLALSCLFWWQPIFSQNCSDNMLKMTSGKCFMRHEMQYDFDFYYFNGPCQPDKTFCLCLQIITVLYYEYPPYIYQDRKTGKVEGILPDMLRQAVYVCCFGCVRIEYHPYIPSISIVQLFGKPYTIFAPLFTHANEKTYGLQMFVRVMGTPGVAFVELGHGKEKHLLKMFNAFTASWPLLVFSLLLAFQAGIVIWLTDTWYNPDEFPRKFPKGPMEGVWWAFVSMTTVGYGDRSPKSPLARTFAVLWIMFGVAISGLFTASLTSALTNALKEEPIALQGKKIGVMNVTRYEEGIVTREGGIPVEFRDIKKLKAALVKEEIEGILIDVEALKYYWVTLSQDIHLHIKKGLTNSPTAYGIGFPVAESQNITVEQWWTFLSGFFYANKDNEDTMRSMAEKRLPEKLPEGIFKPDVNTDGTIFDSPIIYNGILMYTGISVVVFVAVGVIFEICRRLLAASMDKWIASKKIEDASMKYNREEKDIKRAQSLIHELQELLAAFEDKKKESPPENGVDVAIDSREDDSSQLTPEIKVDRRKLSTVS